MKLTKNFKYAGAVLVAAVISLSAYAATIVYNANLVNEPALTTNTNYSLDLQANGIGAMSAQAVYSSATIAAQSFQDGRQSTGSFTVVDIAKISTVAATTSITITNGNMLRASLVLPGIVLYNGVDWFTGNTASNTATSLAAAIHAAVPNLGISHPATSAIIYATAPAVGTYYNSWPVTTSSPTALSISSPTFLGGQDAAYISINGQVLRNGQQWYKRSTIALTATDIAAAINANAFLHSRLTAEARNGVVTATSTLNGSAYNYPQFTSNSAGITRSGANMVAGVTPSYTIGAGNSIVTIPANGFANALAVLFSSATGAGVTLGGLTNQATYYVVPLDSNSFKLATSTTNALAGTYVTFTSSATGLTAHTGTFTPLGISSALPAPGIKWQVSNIGGIDANWTDLQVSSITIDSYTAGGANAFWSFGYISNRYLRAKVTSPQTGGLNLVIRVVGTN